MQTACESQTTKENSSQGKEKTYAGRICLFFLY